MESIQEILPLIIPLGIIQFGLLAAALIHIFRHKTYRIGNRPIWILVSLISIIGPVLYFAIGKGDEQ